MRISDWSSDVCSSDLADTGVGRRGLGIHLVEHAACKAEPGADCRIADWNRKDDEAGAGGEGNSLPALKALLMARIAAVTTDDLRAGRNAGRSRGPESQAAGEAGKGTPRRDGAGSLQSQPESPSPAKIFASRPPDTGWSTPPSAAPPTTQGVTTPPSPRRRHTGRTAQ